jgi:hypothetical protein
LLHPGVLKIVVSGSPLSDTADMDADHHFKMDSLKTAKKAALI